MIKHTPLKTLNPRAISELRREIVLAYAKLLNNICAGDARMFADIVAAAKAGTATA